MFVGISIAFEVHRRHHLKASIPRLGPLLEHQPISATSRDTPHRRHSRMLRLLTARRPTAELPEYPVETTAYALFDARVSRNNFSSETSQKIGYLGAVFNSAVGS
jgi:hypothetical protein